MSKRPTRTAGAADKAGATTNPALVNDATPAGATPAPGGVVPADTPTTPAVPGTEPLPSDQATAAPRPVAADVVTDADADRLAGDRPSVVPETPTVDELTAPADRADAVRGDVVMERVPGTVPLPADQITPVAPVAASSPASLAASLAMMSDEDRATFRQWLGMGEPAEGELLSADPAEAVDAFAGVRLFPVDYDVDHDGRLYTPGGEPMALTFEEYRHFARATAVSIDWLRGEPVDA